MEEVICQFLHLLNDTESFIKRSPGRFETDDLETFLRDFRNKRVNPLYRRVSRLDSPGYVLSMVGLTNVGKSTLAQALLGHPVAPRGNGPTTAIPVEYLFSPCWSIKTTYRETQRIVTTEFESAGELFTNLQTMVLSGKERHSDASNGIEKIVVRGPMELLEKGVILADTPGFGAAQVGEGAVSHQDNLVAYLKDQVHEVMFCLSGRNLNVGNDELRYFKAIQELCSTVIVTKWDEGADEHDHQMKRYEDRFSDLFPYCRFLFVEAKWEMEGRERSGIDALRDLIRLRATPENRVEALREEVVTAWNDLHELAVEPLRRTGASGVPWHKAALPRFLSAAGAAGLELASIV